MRRLLEMIDQVKSQSSIGVIIPTEAEKRLNKKYDTRLNIDLFFKFIGECQPFVFSPKNSTPEEIDGQKIYEEESSSDDWTPPKVDSPFKVWSAEIAGNNYLTIPRDSDGEFGVSIISFMAVEQDPGEYFYFTYCKIGNKLEVVITTDLDLVAKELVKRLYTEKTGIEPGRTKIKVGSGTNKKFVKLNRAIHIRPKRLVSVDTKTVDGKEIDWSHRWTVRGHWRSIEAGKIGKDREGIYCINGFTWVSDYIKGPEDRPVIQKTRLVTV